MESVYLCGREKPALLFNGNRLWDLEKQAATELPGLPKANGKAVHRMGFYHAIPADLTGDGNEDLVVYEPTSTRVFVYTMDDPANSAVHVELSFQDRDNTTRDSWIKNGSALLFPIEIVSNWSNRNTGDIRWPESVKLFGFISGTFLIVFELP